MGLYTIMHIIYPHASHFYSLRVAMGGRRRELWEAEGGTELNISSGSACSIGWGRHQLSCCLARGLWYRARLQRQKRTKLTVDSSQYINSGRMPSVTWNGASIIISPMPSPFQEARQVLAFLGRRDQHGWAVTKGTCLFRQEGTPYPGASSKN